MALDTYSEEKCRALARLFARNGTWQVPTLIRLRTLLLADDPAYARDPNLRYVAPATRALWCEVLGGYGNAPEEWRTTYRRIYDADLRILGVFRREGVKLLAGSDTGGQWVVPGFGLHQKFRELAKAGLTPLEVLQTATLNAAEFLGRSATMGAVEEGKTADLVLLDANPIENVDNLARISGVVLKGRYYDKPALDSMKAEVEEVEKTYGS